ncbi:PAS domain-containing protein [Sorangium sp. So ce1097]|uniref:PAS domain-containing protein n=1 Tax=Sorangium sp. So ce1097 TaxID=3133330 RepID=UPI003F5E6817
MSSPASSAATPSLDRCARSLHLADGTFVTASPAAAAVDDAAAEALVGRRLQDLVAPEDIPAAESALGEAMRSSDAVSFVARLRGGGDAPRRIEIVAHAEDGAAGERRLCCTARDAATGARAVAEHAQLSSRAEEMGRRLERLIASVPGIVWEIWFADDPSRQRVSFVSERALDLRARRAAPRGGDRAHRHRSGGGPDAGGPRRGAHRHRDARHPAGRDPLRGQRLSTVASTPK